MVVMTSSAAGMITVAMIALASANSGMSRHVNRRLQMVSVHRVVILFFSVERNQFDGDESGEEATREEPAQGKPKAVEGIKDLLTADRRHVVYDVPHGTTFTDVGLHGAQDLMNGVFADDSEILDEFVDGVFDDSFRLVLDVAGDRARFLQQRFGVFF